MRRFDRRKLRETISHHRSAIALGALVALVAGSLLIVTYLESGAPDAGSASPSFTYERSWSLLELERHVQAGEVVGVTATSEPDGMHLVARTTSGELVPVSLAVPAGQAAAALATMGYSDVLTAEAWEAAANAAPLAEGNGGPFEQGLSLGLVLGVVVVLLLLLTRARGAMAGFHDGTARFATIMPGSSTR